MKNIIDFTNFTKKIFASTLLTSMLATLLISATLSSAMAVNTNTGGNTVTLTPVADTTYGSGPISITATLDPAVGNVTFTWSGSCNLTGTGETRSINITGAGSCTVTATKNTQSFASVTFNIAKKDITMSTGDFANPSKIYDGTTVASIIANPTAITFSGVINGDDSDATKLSVNTSTGVATLSSKDATTTVANNVTFTGYTLQGTKSANYNLTNQPLPETQIVNKRAITVTPATTTKAYDATTVSATVPSASPAVATGDTGAFTQSYVTANVATAKTMTATGTVTDGNNGDNYTITFLNSNVGAVTKKELTVTGLTASNKAYDGNISATGAGIPTLVGVMASDTVTLGGSAAMSFLSSTVANGKTVNVTGLTISGTSSSEYSLTQPTLTANITAKDITISGLSVANKIYDGLTTAVMSGVATLVGVINTDLLNVRLGGTPIAANFDTKNASTSKLVNITGYTASGTAAANYNLIATTTADITKRTLTVTATAANKVYDGNTNAVVTFSDNRVTGDVITITGTANFSSKTVANTKLVTITGLTITGTDAANYTLSTTTATATANITKKNLTANVISSSKVYDANTAAIPTGTSTDVVSGDFVNYTFTSSNFINKNVGIAKLVTVTGIALGNATDTANYNLLNSTATTNANITARDLVVSSVVMNKVYNGTTAATATSMTSNSLLGDVIGAIASTTSNFVDKNAGTNKLVTTNILIGAGADNANYNLPLISTTTANITKRTLNMLSASGTNKEYDGSRYGFVSITDDRIIGDVLMYASTTSLFDTKNTGDTKSITVSGVTETGTDAMNYILASTSITTPINVKITKKSATITAENKTKVSGDVDPSLTSTTTGMITGDTLTGSLVRVPGENVGTYTINQGTLTAGNNYVTTFATGTFTIAEAAVLPPVIVENFAGSLISSTNLSSNATRRNSDGSLQVLQVLGASKFKFNKNLKLGMKNNNDVRELQKALKAIGLYASTSTNGNFDNELFKAVKAYQKINKVTPVSGYFGPITRVVINK